MAKRNKGYRNRTYSGKKKRSNLERHAYYEGLVTSGLENANSKITESYQAGRAAGIAAREKKSAPKKTMF